MTRPSVSLIKKRVCNKSHVAHKLQKCRRDKVLYGCHFLWADCDFIISARLPTVSCHVIPCVLLWAAASVWSWCQALKKRQQQLQQIQDPTTVASPGGGSWCWPCWLLQHLKIMDPSNANLADECSCFILFTSHETNHQPGRVQFTQSSSGSCLHC